MKQIVINCENNNNGDTNVCVNIISIQGTAANYSTLEIRYKKR